MKRLGVIFGLFLVLVGCCYLILSDTGGGSSGVGELEMYCAAGLQRPVEEIVRDYESEYGVKVRLNFGGSGQLYARMKVAGGDLYLPADVSYIDQAKSEDLVGEGLKVSHLTAGMIVGRGNPKHLNVLSDLTGDDVRVVIAERSAAVGEYSHSVLEEAGLLGEIERGVISKVGTVNEVALQVELGASDVGIVWDALIPQFRQCEFVRVPEFEGQGMYAAIGILKGSQRAVEALKFARYLTAKDKGARVFREHGFDVMFKKDEKTSE